MHFYFKALSEFDMASFSFIAPFGAPGRLRQPAFHVPLCSMDEPNAPSSKRAIVVGAGVAGLAAAKVLGDSGVSVTLVEASDGVGGRVRSDVVDGFILDRGFQVFIEAYPECREL